MSVGAVNKQTGERIPAAGMPAIDAALSGSSTNPVQNRVVKAALDEKADTDIVASDFSTATSYTADDYCIYEGKFYKFKTAHSGAWAAADVDEIKIAGELSSLKSGLTGLAERTNATASVEAINAAGASYTVPAYGYLCGSIAGNGSQSGFIAVNNVEMASNASITAQPFLLFVKAGDVVTSRNIGTYYVRFYPLP